MVWNQISKKTFTEYVISILNYHRKHFTDNFERECVHIVRFSNPPPPPTQNDVFSVVVGGYVAGHGWLGG